MAGKYIVDHWSTEQQIIDLIEQGVDESGQRIRFSEFEHNANRRIELFFRELRNGVRLTIDEQTGHVDRLTRGVRLMMYELRRKIFWREVMRSWPHGRVSRKLKKFTVSETCELTLGGSPESFEDAALRCLKQELAHLWEIWGYTPTKDDLQQIAPYTYEQARLVNQLGISNSIISSEVDDEGEEEPVYWSTTWIGLRTRTRAKTYPYYFDLNSPDFSLRALTENGVHFFKDVDDQTAQDGIDPRRNTPEANWVQIYLRAEPDVRPGIR